MEQLLASVAFLCFLTLAWTRIAVERVAKAGLEARSSSTARISVVLPEPDEPIRSTLPTRRLASFLARATAISRIASCWPNTRFDSAAAILAGGGMELKGLPLVSRTAWDRPAMA
jgi:hypothetical protein